MAEIALGAVVQSLHGVVCKQLLDEASLLYGVKDDVEWIERELKRMQCFLKDAEAKAKDDERIKNWIREVQELAGMAEDVVDTFNLSGGTSRKRDLCRNLVSIIKKPKTYHTVGKQIQEIKLKIQEVSQSRSTYGIVNIDMVGERSNYEKQRQNEWRRSSPRVEEPDFVGFKKDMELLEARLLRQEERRCVVSITGMGGMGKTTLAKKLYNRVRNNFTFLAWICISQEYVVEDLLQHIGKGAGLPELKLKEMYREELEEELHKFLMKKKYLIVLDDIWKTRTWDELQGALPDGVSGSKIIITTRNRDVAIHADPRTPAHELTFLSEEESWELFSRKVFPSKEIDYPPELEALGRNIVAKCGGLPLALVVMGGLLLRKQRRVQAWKAILQSMNWQLAQDDNRCMKILALSFNDLPDYLKSCFLYFGIFPEDHEIHTNKLINLWVAEGFIEPRGQETLEDVAEDCLDELTGRSLIQPVTRRFDGRIKSCRIHDLLRDICISKAKEGNFLYVCDKVTNPAQIPTRARRLAFHCKFSPNPNNNRIRTLISFQSVHMVDLRYLSRAFKFLVILDLPGLGSKLPREIGELVKLKFLGLRGAVKQSLPSSICNLINLQTLDGRGSILEVPATIWKLRRLRHLYVGIDSEIHLEEKKANDVSAKTVQQENDDVADNVSTEIIEQENDDVTTDIQEQEDDDFTKEFPEQENDVADDGISVSALQTLSQLNTYNMKFDEWKLVKNLKSLRKLKLYGNYMNKEDLIGLPGCLDSLYLDKGCQTFQGLVLSSYQHLHKLSLKGRLEKLPDIHEFPPHLANLTLAYSLLLRDPMPLLERLPHLRCLTLLDDSYVGDKMVCSTGGFQRLEDLELVGLRKMLEWEITGGMQRLERLTIHSCSKLNKIPDGLTGVTTLKVLDINMPSSFNSRLEPHKVDWDKIKHIPSIITTINKSEPRLERIPTGVLHRRQEDLPWYLRPHEAPRASSLGNYEHPPIQKQVHRPRLAVFLPCIWRKKSKSKQKHRAKV